MPEPVDNLERAFAARAVVLRGIGTGRWVLTDADGEALVYVERNGAAGPLVAVVAGFLAGVATLTLALKILLSVASPEVAIFGSIAAFFLMVIAVAAALLGRGRPAVVVYADSTKARPILRIGEEDPGAIGVPRFAIHDEHHEDLGRIVGRQLETPSGECIARATAVPEKPLAASLVAKLGLAANRLDTERLSLATAEGEELGELRRHAELLGGALLTCAQGPIAPRLLLAFVIGLEMLTGRRPARFP